MPRLINSLVFAVFCLGSQISLCAEWSDTTLVKNQRVNEITVAALSYASVALACGDNRGATALKERLLAMLRLASKKSALTTDGRETLKNPDHFISLGAGVFKAKPYIQCDEAENINRQILQLSDALLNVNN